MKKLRTLNLRALLGTFFLALAVPTYSSFWGNLFGTGYKLACNAHTDNPDVSCLDKRFLEMGEEVCAQSSVQADFRESYFPKGAEIGFYYDPRIQDPFFSVISSDEDELEKVLLYPSIHKPKFIVGQGSRFQDQVNRFKLSQHEADSLTCGSILHELGHIVNKDHCKEYIYYRKNDQSFIQSPGVQNFLKDQPEFKKLLLEKDLSDSLPLSFSRNEEERADDFEIKHTTNPFALLFEFKNYKYYNRDSPDDGSGTHPSHAERAEKFQDAAQKLMLKQMLEGGRSLGRKD